MGHKILLADDSITIQKVVNLTFSDEGIEVVTVGNGELAVRRLNEVQPDIVLADIYMPGKSGYEVCEYIKTNPQYSHIPVLLLVGAFEPFDPTEAVRVKADGHLTKPFESRALVATVNRLIANNPKRAVTPVPTQTPSWQNIPPDATTTKLSPEIAARYQTSFSPELQKVEPFMASPVTPIQAKPVTPIQASPVMPIQASPVFPASPITPIQASPVFPESFAPPKPEPVFPPSSSANNFVDKVFSFDDSNSAPITTVPEETSDKMQLDIDRGPVFDLDAPPPPSEPTFELELSDDTYNTSEQKDSSTLAFDPNANVSTLNNQTQMDKSVNFEFTPDEPVEEENSLHENKYDEYENTQIMGSASRKELFAAYSAYSSSAPSTSKTQDHKDMSLDIDFGTQQSSSFEVKSNAETEDVSTVSEDNYSYDDFSPLELEPLEEVGYSQTQEQNTSASTPHTTDELPAISDEYVFESTTSEIKREPLLDIEEIPSPEVSRVEELSLDIGRITSSQDVARVTETIPQIPEPIATPIYTQETPALTEMYVSEPIAPIQHHEEPKYITPNPVEEFNYSEPISNIPDYASSPMPLSTVNSNLTSITNEEDPLGLESQDHPLEIDESPSQFELEQAPTHYYTEPLSSNYNAIAEEPLADLVTPESVSNTINEPQTVFETNAGLESVLELPEVPEPTPVLPAISNPISTTTFVEEENLPTATDLASASAFVSSPIIALSPVSTIPSLVETNTVVENLIAKPVVESDNQTKLTAITSITSIDQIPQHLIDQIVQRVISQLSENVVREIAWEVVPDLAEILIKKQLEKKVK
ncbi:MAG: response regulator [Acidobacteria bacterium]|nr:response regulator [Acidobacteriota bacterium]